MLSRSEQARLTVLEASAASHESKIAVLEASDKLHEGRFAEINKKLDTMISDNADGRKIIERMMGVILLNRAWFAILAAAASSASWLPYVTKMVHAVLP